ncbi:helix-turn-helix transcriptional regulator [Sanguibacter sp. A247]|uniref:helix-turn-helix transcriptional regulator n=1 Tax=unclassified Sanguibacter TaxID=2645534 RepID=UPI003FD83867
MRISTAADLGALARQARLDKGMTQSDLAEKIGTSRQWVAQFESGAPNVRLELVLGALRALELRVDVGPEQTRERPLPSSMGALARWASESPIVKTPPPLTISQAILADALQPVRDASRMATLSTFGLGGSRFGGAIPPESPLAGIIADQAIRLAQIERRPAAGTEGIESPSDTDEEGR